MKEIDYPSALIAKLVPLFFILILLIVLALSAFVVVQPGHVGVKVRLGKVKLTHLPEGLHFKIPLLDKVEQILVRQTTNNTESSSASADLQTVTTNVTIIYSLVDSFVPKVFQKIGDRRAFDDVVINPAIAECVKAVTARYNAEQLIQERSKVKLDVESEAKNFITKTLAEKKLENAIVFHNVSIRDFSFSHEFDKAIEAKVKAEQDALKAKNEKVKLVTQAEASAEQKRLAADAMAYQIEQESIARAEAIKREAEALKNNPHLIQLRFVEKWNGQLPRFSGAGNPIPMLNINDLMEEKKN